MDILSFQKNRHHSDYVNNECGILSKEGTKSCNSYYNCIKNKYPDTYKNFIAYKKERSKGLDKCHGKYKNTKTIKTRHSKIKIVSINYDKTKKCIDKYSNFKMEPLYKNQNMLKCNKTRKQYVKGIKKTIKEMKQSMEKNKKPKLSKL